MSSAALVIGALKVNVIIDLKNYMHNNQVVNLCK